MDSLNQATREGLRYLASKGMPQHTFAMLDTLYQVIMILLGFWSLPLEVMIRYAFGENYASNLRFLVALALLGTYTFLYSLYAVMAGNPMAFWAYSGMVRSLLNTGVSGLAYHLFYYGFIGAMVIHRYHIWKRAREGVPWLSTCFGISHLAAIPWQRLIDRIPYVSRFVTVDDWFLYRFLEPGLCFLLSRLIYQIDGLLGSYLVIASVALFIKNNMVYAEARSRVLEMFDAVIESRYLADALAGQPKEMIAGFTVVPVPFDGLFADDGWDNESVMTATFRAE